MSIPEPFPITKDTLKALRGRSESERLLHRLHSVTLVLHGFSVKAVATIYGDAPRSVAYWVTRFKEQGIDGLRDKPRSGRPVRLIPSQMKELRSFVESKRASSETVTAPMVSEFIEKSWSIKLTLRQCLRILRQLV